MSKNLSPDEVCHRLVMFLATKGVALSKSDQAEIRARVMGHENVAQQTRYEQNAARLQVFELSTEDIGADGTVTLKETLSCLPLEESTSMPLARVMAAQTAALRGQPVVLCDGNFQNVEVFDEQVVDSERLGVFQAYGVIHDVQAAELGPGMAEDFSMHSRHGGVREAVAAAKRVLAGLLEEKPADETCHHLVVVASEVDGSIFWRGYR